MRLKTFLASQVVLQASLWTAAQDIYSITRDAPFATGAIAEATATASLIPFSVDFLSLPDHQNQSAFDKYSTAQWKTTVAVYEESGQFDTLVGVSWPVGQGPGAERLANGDIWSACVVAVPHLFETLNVASPGNGSCFDVIDKECMNFLVTEALSAYSDALIDQRYPTADVLAEACQYATRLPLISKCFGKSTDDISFIDGYGSSNPLNARPFLVSIDKYAADGVFSNKTKVQSEVTTRAWPVIILLAQDNNVLQASFSCPSPRSPVDSQPELIPSPDGTCGGSIGYKCNNTKYFWGSCCSRDGFCGYSEEECSQALGCQPKYGLCDALVTVTTTIVPGTPTTATPTPTAAFHARTFYQQTCGGNIHNDVNVGKDGMCINTSCQVGGLDTAGEGYCPDGQVQVSYWQNEQCTGEWYGYEYTSKNSCKALWSQGWKFKSLYLRCTDKKNDCMSKGSCVADPEPSIGSCQTPPETAMAFTAKSYYHNDCTGATHNDISVKSGSNGFCVNTDCQVASLDIAAAGDCPNGHVQISYWEQSNCQGQWYGYGYANRGTCRGLWSDGWNFKSIWMKCTDPAKDCVNQGTCKADPEPKSPKC